MEISTARNATALPLATQTLPASASASAKTTQVPAGKDQVQVSDEALASSRKAADGSAAASDGTLLMLGDLLNQVTGSTVEQLSYQETDIAAESASLSFSGTIATRDGKEVSFGLQLQYDHVSVQQHSATFQAGTGGLSLSYQGNAAELTSRSFSFSLSAGADSQAVTGKGVFRLNDEVSRIAKEMKPMVKEFMAATGANGGWGEVNRLLRSTV
ncbi:hypothetical protein [Geomonas subterranea]|uniref:Uncharacterized protein n=1 Tax=Geomonas subterranea TaxID=2847989 RepID=A0ABX8LLL8_9BACT|nr:MULTISPECIES: hypothetical protein [Geomonas]QXE92945.1 hypothetical protein KP001_10675 [Geomonas subterranea]QXM08949.1 hypothetical protein KP002_18600 [Geomonas subterranea]